MGNRALRRLFLVYISFFACLALLIIPFYGLSLSLYTRNSLRLNEEMLQKGMLSLENELKNISATGFALFSDSSFTILGNSELPLSSHKIYMLSKASKLVSDMFLYMGSQINAGVILRNGIILTSSGNCYTFPDQLYGKFLIYDGYNSYNDWFSYITDFSGNYTYKGSNSIIQNNKSYEAITFVQRLLINTNRNDYILYATLNKDYITQMLIPPDIMTSFTLCLTDSNGNVLLNIGGDPAHEYTTISYTSKDYGLTAIVGIDKTLFSQGLSPLRILILIFSLSYIFVGIILSLMYSWRSFKPLNTLVRLTTGLSVIHSINDQSPNQFKTDYDYIQHFLQQTDFAFKTYKAKLEHQSALLRSYMIGCLLNGQIYSDRTYHSAKEYFPEFPLQYRVITLRLDIKSQLSLSELSKHQILWQSVVDEFLPKGGIQHIMDNLIVLIWPCNDERNITQIKTQLSDLQRKLQTMTQFTCNAAVSSCFSEIENLASAHRQSLNLLRTMCEAKPNQLLVADDLEQSRNLYYEIMDSIDLNLFCELLRCAQAQSAKNMINKTLAFIEQTPGFAEEYIRCIYYTYQYGILFVCNEFKYNGGAEISQVAYNTQVNVHELFEKLLICIDKLCKYITEQQQLTSERLGKEVIQFIKDNFTNPDMYAKLVIERFSITEHALQKYVQNITGKSFFEYLEHLRMEYAKQLISEKKVPLREVAKMCGYSSYNAFYKAFKRNFNMSPSTKVTANNFNINNYP
ncbi:MAG TPA: helix-turn-helix transcriptional regulator [Clostridiaceae bacterium]|nr:helix-turn-helix transcriptional regulator [Clostridiaceae bacterium]